MLEHALQYVGRGWRVFPVHTTVTGRCSCGRDCGKDSGKHPHIKAWQKHATTDVAQIESWWSRWPTANIGLATGAGLLVLDLDGAAEIARFAAIAAPHGGLPVTLVARTGRGYHVYLAGDMPGSRKQDGLLVRGLGGYVIAPPSWHASGQRYQWVKDVPLSVAPDWFLEWAQSADKSRLTVPGGSTPLTGIPAYIQAKNIKPGQGLIARNARKSLDETPQTAAEVARIESALAAIPANCARDPWLHVGMALHGLGWDRPDGSDLGFELWRAWSETGGDKFQGTHDLETRWRSFGKRSDIGLGTVYHLATQHGWAGLAPPAAPEKMPPAIDRGLTNSIDQTDITSAASHDNPLFQETLRNTANGHTVALPLQLSTPTADSPLIVLNQRFACIGDLGGKCMVLGWVPSRVDETLRVPSFQTFKSFAERYSHQYVMVQKPKGGEWVSEPAQLGATWLKWRQRRSFEGIDLVPGPDAILPGNMLNLWSGFSVDPQPGRWDRMRDHIVDVLADRTPECVEYITKWSAWAVQNPGERAEVALVFRGDKGAGKGTFAHALRRMFGQHGLHVSNPKHLVGAFNAHLRNCLLLYADEAFWAGDKQGESVLKALITEPVQMIEQKGVDAAQWRNRVHLVMTANAEWVVPASHDERRYAVFNVSNKRLKDEKYFAAIYDEMKTGGLAAMLYDLQRIDLKGWHPRRIPSTEALREQKIRSMTALQEWWETILQDGTVPAAPKEMPDTAYAHYLVSHCRDFAPRLKELTSAGMGRFLAQQGCVKLHRQTGNAWRFPTLAECRNRWERHYQGWVWERDAGGWATRT